MVVLRPPNSRLKIRNGSTPSRAYLVFVYLLPICRIPDYCTVRPTFSYFFPRTSGRRSTTEHLIRDRERICTFRSAMNDRVLRCLSDIFISDVQPTYYIPRNLCIWLLRKLLMCSGSLSLRGFIKSKTRNKSETTSLRGNVDPLDLLEVLGLVGGGKLEPDGSPHPRHNLVFTLEPTLKLRSLKVSYTTIDIYGLQK